MLSRHWRLWLSFPSSPDPFSRRAAGNRLVRSFGLVRPCELGASSIGLAVVTAADRAAATFAAWGNEPLRPHIAGTSPFRGGFAGSTVQRLPTQRGFRVCGSGISYLWARPKGFAITLRKPSALAYRLVSCPALEGRGGSVSRRDHNLVYRRSVTLAGARKLERRTELIPQLLFGRGGLGERRFSQRSGLSPRISLMSSFREAASLAYYATLLGGFYD